MLHARSKLTLLLVAIVLSGLGLPGWLPGQRQVRPLTTNGNAHSDPKLSPDGQWVAFKTRVNGRLALGVVGTRKGSKESILASGTNLTFYHWSPTSFGLFFQDGSTLNFIRANGGTVQALSRISGNRVRVLAVDPAGKFLMGVRADAKGNNAIFTIASDGKTLATDILTNINDFFADITIDPTSKKFAYTAQVRGTPREPIDVRMADIDGKNDRSLTGGPIPRTKPSKVDVTLPRNLCWADSGTTVIFTAVDNTTGTWQVMRVTPTRALPELMTSPPLHHMRSSVSGDLSTIVYRASTQHGHWVPGILPSVGGGRVLLEPELDWIFDGDPTIDRSGKKIAFTGYKKGTPFGRAEVWLIELDREVRVAPHPALGKKITFQLPAARGETGTLFVSTGLLDPDNKKVPLPKLPGFVYALAIDPKILIPLLSGKGTGGPPLSFTATVPTDTALIGFTVYLQGLRVAAGGGDLTRYVELQFFK